MRSHHYRKGNFTISSDKLLRMDQNLETPKLDVLVRESIQNSLDAMEVGEEQKGGVVRVDFTIGQYVSEELAKYLPDLTIALSDVPTEYLAIRDSGTTGLKGPIRLSDVEGGDSGNYISLVKGMMDSCKDSASAGGSWGIGKVIYYKIGINLVIYYSRVRTDNGFESRLSAVWMDDGEGRFVPPGLESSWLGISLWGMPEKDDVYDWDVLPITDGTEEGRAEIEGVLRAFSIEPYGDEETGTTVIVPGFNRDLIEKEIRDKSEGRRRWWASNAQEYIWFAIQKWFFPRLHGSGSDVLLLPSINGELKTGLLPFFEKMQRLYRATLTLDDPGCKWKHVNVEATGRKGLTSETGTVAWRIVPKDELKSGPNFDDPYDLCGIDAGVSSEGNHGIVVYTRSVGMVVTYKDSELWDQIPSVGEDAYLIGVFRLNPDTEYPYPNKDIRTIEDYFRCGERADHFKWIDIPSYNNAILESCEILKRTFSNIARFIKVDMRSAEDARLKGRQVHTGRKVAESLFPPGGHFVTHDMQRKEDGKAKGARSKGGDSVRTEMRNLSWTQEEDCVAVSMDLVFRRYSKTTLEVSASYPSAGKKVMNSDMWRQELGTGFPFRIISVEVNRVEAGGKDEQASVVLEEGMQSRESGRLVLKRKGPTRVSVSCGRRDVTLGISVRVSRPSSDVTPVISVDSGDEP